MISSRRSSKIEEHIANSQSEINVAVAVFAQIASSAIPENYYNPRSNLIAVSHDSKIYWAYLMNNEHCFPDPTRHNVLWLRHNKVDALPDNEPIPDSIPDTLGVSIAFLVPKIEFDHLVDPSTSAALGSDYMRNNQERLRIYHGRRSSDPVMRTGLVFNEDSGDALLKGPESEIIMDNKGTHFTGQLHNREMDERGLFAQNPISFLIPETMVTFPGALKHLPNFNKFIELGSMLLELNSLRNIIQSLSEL